MFFEALVFGLKHITKICNIHRFISAVKIENFIRKKKIFLLFLHKTLIVSTR